MNAVPPSMMPGSAGCHWSALNDAAAVIAALAGVDCEEERASDFPFLIGKTAEWRRELAERALEDMAAMVRPGIEGLAALAARGVDPRAPALALWRELTHARGALLALGSHEDAMEPPHGA